MLSVREIPASEHLGFIEQQRSASFLQTPAWGRVKSEWRAESLGFFRGEQLTGVALVLYRQLPRLRRYLAYLPEGPVIDWSGDLDAHLTPLAAHLRERRAFGVRIGPPVVSRRWDAATVKQGLADPAVRRLDDLPPTARPPLGDRVVAQLHDLGWRQQAPAAGFGLGQPRHVFQVPLAGRSEDDVLAGMNQQWRRNIRKAEKSGVEVAAPATTEEALAALPAFHELYVETARRDGFTPRPLAYFRAMLEALGGEHPDRVRLHLARHEGELVAATVGIRVGVHAWYSYGASATAHREVRGSNAVQWAMIRHAIAAGADVYDLRGITDTLDADDPHVGLLQFKVGTGGEAVEYAGEWDLPLHRPLYAGFSLYLRRRAAP